MHVDSDFDRLIRDFKGAGDLVKSEVRMALASAPATERDWVAKRLADRSGEHRAVVEYITHHSHAESAVHDDTKRLGGIQAK
jgi:hypothetical protein